MTIRQAQEKDVSTIAETLVYNNRTNFFPIFKDEGYSFGELQVISVAHKYLLISSVLPDIHWFLLPASVLL